ncbi:hypothetical protein FIBSPDRAFT_825474, partial [Athelia psychrophila]
MDMYANTTPWQQPNHPQHQFGGDPLLGQHDGRPASVDTWKDRVGGGSSSGVQQGMDMNDFTLGDLPAPPNPSASPPSQFNIHNIYTPSSFSYGGGPPSFTSNPYNTASAWPGQSSTTVPLSSYSTLNGATTSTAGSSQQHSPPSSHMMIDPALTTMNGSSSDSLQQYAPTPNYSTSQYGQPQLPQRQHTQSYQPTQQHNQQQQQQQQPLSINPSALDPSPFMQFFQTQQAQQQQHQQPHMQGTLSPHALHAPHASLMPPIMPQAFYPADPLPAAQPVNPQVRIDRFHGALKAHLQPTAFNGAGAVNALTDLIMEFGSPEVSAPTRLEILTKIRDNAGNHYFRAWSENPVAIDITREWLKAGATAKGDSPLVETIMPLLQIIDRLPLTIDTLKTSKLGKIVVKLTKDPPAPAIKDMAQNVERRWRQLLSGDGAKAPESEDAKSKKRKSTEPPPARTLPPAKKAVGLRAAPVQREPTTAKTVAPAKSDSSFFS